MQDDFKSEVDLDGGDVVDSIDFNEDLNEEEVVVEEEVVLEKESVVEQEVIVDGVTWTGISVGKEIALASRDMFDGYDYELWKKDVDGVSALVETFELNQINNIDWEGKDGHVLVKYYVGGMEGGTKNDIFYDFQGEELLRVVEQIPQRYEISISQNASVDPYLVSLITDKDCLYIKADYSMAPEVVVNGVKIKHLGDEQEFLLDNPIETKCKFYDGWISPSLEKGNISESNIEFSLPEGFGGIINLSDEGVLGVEFL